MTANRLPRQRRMAAGTCVALLMAATAAGQGQEKVTPTAPVHPTSAAPKKIYAPASVQASPGLQCKLHPIGSAPSAGLAVFTDDDGYARFHAVRAAAGDAAQRLTLDCTDPAGKASSYAVDLASDDTFAPRPVNLAKERGTDRPALKGDPLSYSQYQLIQAGYGLRPDPVKDVAAYSRWLTAASRPGRLLEAKRPDKHSHGVTSILVPWWVGSALTGDPNYISTEATFNVPYGIPGGDQTTCTAIAIWNGLGGLAGSGLIQGGVNVDTTPTIATYNSWREYCCGDPNSNGYGGAFIPNPGDQIYSQEWYCDSTGNLNINGGYGCTYLEDEATGAILNCTSATGSPCWSVKALPLCSVSPSAANCMTLGLTAEFVIEDQSPQVSPSSGCPTLSTAFTDFTPTVTMAGSAYSSQTGSSSQTISTDPNVSLMTDFTNTTTHMVVWLGTTNETYFSVSSSSQPIVTGLSPSSGPNTGGTQVMVSGEGFGSATSQPQITFGQVPAIVVGVCAPTLCNVITPPYIVGQGLTPQSVNVQVAVNGNTSPQTQSSSFTYMAGPVCTAALSCKDIPPGLFPVLLLQCQSAANFYQGYLSQTPDSTDATSYSALTNDLPGWQAVACIGQQPTPSGGFAGGSCSFYPAYAPPTYCGAAPAQPPNFCQECRKTGGICTTEPSGRKICIHE